MNRLYYDLHIHSCLSPCGDDLMTPANITGMAKVNDLDLIAVTDHNSCKNCRAAIEFGESYGIIVLPGMELCTAEEVHVLCLFAHLEDAENFSDYVYSKLLKIKNDEKIFGSQLIYNERDELIAKEENLLINATEISIDHVSYIISDYKGIIVPAHVDKSSNSLLSNLGFIPEDLHIHALEYSSKEKRKHLINKDKRFSNYKYLINSDAHYLHQINRRRNYIEVETNDKRDILKAIVG